VGHAAVALFHHFVLRDDVLECMAPAIQRHVPSKARNRPYRCGPKRIRGMQATR
jgi:hypothetical protein